MSTQVLPHPVDTKNDSIKLPLTFGVEKMKKEVLEMGLNTFIYYNVLPLRSQLIW